MLFASSDLLSMTVLLLPSLLLLLLWEFKGFVILTES